MRRAVTHALAVRVEQQLDLVFVEPDAHLVVGDGEALDELRLGDGAVAVLVELAEELGDAQPVLQRLVLQLAQQRLQAAGWRAAGSSRGSAAG